ncbi:MAG TPA: GNAT family N-acetyltransferase [Jatrophihabitans sp.]|nr:GNAT family N-acetyltransferase [Jatrophihabitans sp.]
MHTTTGNTLAFRPLTESDLPLLAEWIARPHVARWWYEPVGSAAVRAEYLPCVHGTEPTHALVAQLDGIEVGFAQWYRWADYPEHAGKLGADEDEAGIDYLVADPARCSQGFGTRLVGALIEQVRLAWPAVAGLVVDPEQGNRASCRVLEKNGFHLVRVVQLEAEGHPVGPTAVYRRRFSAQPR